MDSSTDWDPLKDICIRTKEKLKYWRLRSCVSISVQNALEKQHEIFKYQYVKSGYNTLEQLHLLEKFYELEKILDAKNNTKYNKHQLEQLAGKIIQQLPIQCSD